MSNKDMDFNLDLDLNGVSEDLSEESAGFDPDVSNIIGVEMGFDSDNIQLDDTDFVIETNDDGLVINLDNSENDGTEIDLEDEGLDATILSSVVDVSKIALGYYNTISNVKVVIMARAENMSSDIIKPTLNNFDYINNIDERMQVYRVFCKTLEDLVCDVHYSSYSIDEAYIAMKSALIETLRFTPNVHEGSFKSTFESCYVPSRKIRQSKNGKTDLGSLSQLIDQNSLDTALSAFMINSVPFYTVSKFFEDASNFDAYLAQKDAIAYKEFLSVVSATRKGIYHQDIRDAIIRFLTADETLSKLGLTTDDSLNLSIGELLRRYLNFELTSWSLNLKDIKKLVSSGFTKELLIQVYTVLMDAVSKDSISATIVCLIMEMLNSYSIRSKDYDMFSSFVVGIANYFSAAQRDRDLISPVFYSYIGKITDENGIDKFELGYTYDGSYQLTTSEDLLCSVIGDNSRVYHIPLVMRMRGFLLIPPQELVSALMGVNGHPSINGTVLFKYTPTFNWVSNLSIASFKKEKKDNLLSGVDLGNSPLLDVLFSYKADFDTSGFDPYIVEIEQENYCRILCVCVDENKPLRLKLLSFYETNEVYYEGLCTKDPSDGTIIVQYQDNSGFTQTIVLSSSSKVNYFNQEEHSKETNLPDVKDLIPLSEECGRAVVNPYIVSIAQHLCDLTAMDYEEELRLARIVVARDLEYLVSPLQIDKLLGKIALENFIRYIESNNGELGSYNFGILKEVLSFTVGVDHCFADAMQWEPSMLSQLKSAAMNLKTSVDTIIDNLVSLDSYVLAAQNVSQISLMREYDDLPYRALHYIPGINEVLTQIENEMIILKSAVQTVDEMPGILKRATPFASALRALNTDASAFEKAVKSIKKVIKSKEDDIKLRLTECMVKCHAPERLSVVKYCILEMNTKGLLTDLEESFAAFEGPDDRLTPYRELLDTLKKELHIPKNIKMMELSDTDFAQYKSGVDILQFYSNHYQDFLELVQIGLLSELSHNVELTSVVAFDIISQWGQYLFKFKEFDTFDRAEFEEDFYRYLGSFFVTYSPVEGESVGDIDSGIDRVTVYTKHPEDFKSPVPLSAFGQFAIEDLKYVNTGNESDSGNSSTSESVTSQKRNPNVFDDDDDDDDF